MKGETRMAGRYSELYRRTREILESEAEALLQRPLTAKEKQLFRSCGTLTMLESLGMKIYYAQNGEELARELASMSMQSRFLLAVKETIAVLEQELHRKITAEEQQAMEMLGDTETLWHLKDSVLETPLERRELVLRQLLTNTTA